MTVSTTTLPEYDRRKVEGDPMIYIVTMLIVFSAGIASLMIIYMKKVIAKLGLRSSSVGLTFSSCIDFKLFSGWVCFFK